MKNMLTTARDELYDALIHGFHVIACETRKIVSGPAGCAYVALSYVWAQSQALRYHHRSCPKLHQQ
jgi:hypothetical protein